jgi:polyisoprenoid-binding protein YceI
MIKLILTLTILFTAVHLTAQSLTLDAEKAVVNFNYVSEKVNGKISGIKATIHFDADHLSKSSITGTAQVKTLTTGIKKRDEHLYSADYFNADKYPVMSYTSTSFEKTETGYKMKGNLTISGNESPVEFTFTFVNSTFEGTAIIYMNDFKVMTKKERENSKVVLKVYFPII